MSTMATEGILACGLTYRIEPSRKKSVGLHEGSHFIATFSGVDLSINALPQGAFFELLALAHQFAEKHAYTPGAYRVAYSGPSVGRRSHAHIHIMLPKGVDKLPTLVDTSES